MSVELRICSPPFFKSPLSSCTPITSLKSFLPILPGGLHFSADEALVDAWPHFPGLKVGKCVYILAF
jgi:hypothetical protein